MNISGWAPGRLASAWTAAFGSTDLNGSASGSSVLSTVIFDNDVSGSRDLLAKISVSLAIASSTIVAGACLSLWLAELLADGTTYGDGRIVTAGAGGAVAYTPPWPAWATIDFGAGATITTLAGVASGLRLPQSKFALIGQNNSGFTLASSGHNVSLKSGNLNSNAS